MIKFKANVVNLYDYTNSQYEITGYISGRVIKNLSSNAKDIKAEVIKMTYPFSGSTYLLYYHTPSDTHRCSKVSNASYEQLLGLKNAIKENNGVDNLEELLDILNMFERL